jgi:ligand-binding sensor domain-containing protein
VNPRLPEAVLREPPNSQQMALQDHTGRWWFSSSSGLHGLIDLRKPANLQLLNGVGTSRFLEDSRGDLWIAVRYWDSTSAPHGLARWSRRSNTLVDETERLPPNARVSGISAFAEDRSGQIWIALGRPGGLLRLSDGRFRSMAVGVNGPVNQLRMDDAGRLWVAATEQGLGRIDDPTADQPALRLYTRSDGLSSDEVWCLETIRSAGRAFTLRQNQFERKENTAFDPARATPSTRNIGRYKRTQRA